jgi:methionine-rich copper-binding protein CopC
MNNPVRDLVRRTVRPCLLAAALLLPLSSVGIASAHALFERATPVPDSILTTAPVRVHIWFSEDLSGASKIIVWDRFRHNHTIGSAVIVPGQSMQLEIALTPLPPGSYLVLWTSVSAADGHILHGSYVFNVKRRGPLPSLAGLPLSSGQQSFPDGPTLVALLAHWLELLCSVVWVGSVAFAVFVLSSVAGRLDASLLRTELRRRNALVLASLFLLLLSSCVLIVTQAYGVAGNDWSKVFTTSPRSAEFSVDYGRLWIGRQLLVLAAVAALIVRRRRTDARDEARFGRGLSSTLLLVLGAVYLYLFAASGHAASALIGTVGNNDLISVSVC